MLEMRDYRFRVEYKMGKKNVIADQLSRPVRMIQGENEASLLGKSREEVMETHRSKVHPPVSFPVGLAISRLTTLITREGAQQSVSTRHDHHRQAPELLF